MQQKLSFILLPLFDELFSLLRRPLILRRTSQSVAGTSHRVENMRVVSTKPASADVAAFLAAMNNLGGEKESTMHRYGFVDQFF